MFKKFFITETSFQKPDSSCSMGIGPKMMSQEDILLHKSASADDRTEKWRGYLAPRDKQ